MIPLFAQFMDALREREMNIKEIAKVVKILPIGERRFSNEHDDYWH